MRAENITMCWFEKPKRKDTKRAENITTTSALKKE